MIKISEYFNANYGKFKEPFGNFAKGSTPFVSSGDADNGVTDFFDLKPTELILQLKESLYGALSIEAN